MFTLKLFRNMSDTDPRHMTKVIAVQRILTMEIGIHPGALELMCFESNQNENYQTYYIGIPEPGMEGFGSDSLHLDSGPGSWWAWGILENAEGHTSEYYRVPSLSRV